MNFPLKCICFAYAKLIGQKRMRCMLPFLAKYAKLDLLTVAYNNIGILKYGDIINSGEHFLITKLLKIHLGDVTRPVFFDVGANIGNYTSLLAKEFPQAQIYSFEPNINTYKTLTTNVSKLAKCINAGMGLEAKKEKIYTYADDLTSTHASMYNEVFPTFHKNDNLVEMEFQMLTLDYFCELESITRIDLLKIDTEGNELNVLKGAKNILLNKQINIIQFEFGESDVFSRVFLKDFYSILNDYNIYRLDTERLIPLHEYTPTNEIFRFQNLLAVRKDIIFKED